MHSWSASPFYCQLIFEMNQMIYKASNGSIIYYAFRRIILFQKFRQIISSIKKHIQLT
jgi:hypothetical protein